MTIGITLGAGTLLLFASLMMFIFMVAHVVESDLTIPILISAWGAAGSGLLGSLWKATKP